MLVTSEHDAECHLLHRHVECAIQSHTMLLGDAPYRCARTFSIGLHTALKLCRAGAQLNHCSPRSFMSHW